MNEHDKFYDKELPYMIINWTNIKNRTVLERYEARKCILRDNINDKWVEYNVVITRTVPKPRRIMNMKLFWAKFTLYSVYIQIQYTVGLS